MSQVFTGDSSGCPHRRFERREVLDYWEGTPTGEFETVDVSPCRWETRSTFSDICKTCGQITRYSNANPDVYNDVPVGSGMSPFNEREGAPQRRVAMTLSDLEDIANMFCVQSYEEQDGEPEIFEFTLQGLYSFLQEANAKAKEGRDAD